MTDLAEVVDFEERVAQIETQLNFLFPQTAVRPEQHRLQLQVVGFPAITSTLSQRKSHSHHVVPSRDNITPWGGGFGIGVLHDDNDNNTRT